MAACIDRRIWKTTPKLQATAGCQLSQPEDLHPEKATTRVTQRALPQRKKQQDCLARTVDANSELTQKIELLRKLRTLVDAVLRSRTQILQIREEQVHLPLIHAYGSPSRSRLNTRIQQSLMIGRALI